MRTWQLSLLFLILANCSSSGSGDGSSIDFPYSTSAQYFRVVPQLTMEVHYEPGAEPFTGTFLGGRNYWSLFEDNINAIMQYRSVAPTLTSPRTLADMHATATLNKTTWTLDDILALHKQYQLSTPTATEGRFYVFFVKGHFSDAGGVETGVIGVSISGTPIIAIFKDTITASGSATVQKYVEQSTLVHEMGHALGFVNKGVPMVVAYEDPSHPGHSNNSSDVMYWLNEGATDMQQFVAHYITTGDTVMWASQELADAQAYSR